LQRIRIRRPRNKDLRRNLNRRIRTYGDSARIRCKAKARGDNDPDSDLDVLLIVTDEMALRKRELRHMGYRLAATGEAVPSIVVYTETEWVSRDRSRSSFRRAVERNQVRVL
jgi:DNA-binding transcriptional regulator YbjK